MAYAMRDIGPLSGGPVEITGLIPENIALDKQVVIKQGSKVIKDVTGTFAGGGKYLGEGTTFDCKSLESYQDLTADNFIIESRAQGTISASSYNSQSWYDDFQHGSSEASLDKIKSYDASTGTLTAYYTLWTRSYCRGGGAGSYGNWSKANIPVKAYFIGKGR